MHDASISLDDDVLAPVGRWPAACRGRCWSAPPCVARSTRSTLSVARRRARRRGDRALRQAAPLGTRAGLLRTRRPRRDLVVDGWDSALGICYDGCFPEHALAATAGGAAAYLVPAAYYVGAEHRRDVYYAARALDNGIYVVFAGLTGRCGSGDFSGGSAVYDPEGRPLQRAGAESPAVVVADLDLSVVRRTQREHPMALDRLDSQGTRLRRRLA